MDVRGYGNFIFYFKRFFKYLTIEIFVCYRWIFYLKNEWVNKSKYNLIFRDYFK